MVNTGDGGFQSDESKYRRRIVLRGNKRELKPIITLLMGLYQLIDEKDVGTILEAPGPSTGERRTTHPEIVLHFREDTDFIRGANQTRGRGQDRTKGRISFRLMNETSATITQGNLTALGNLIKQQFGQAGGYLWGKGKTMYSYCDWDKGYQFQILSRTKAQAQEIITRVMILQSHTPDWKLLNKIENDQEQIRYSQTPGTQIIMGQQKEKEILRPNVNVRFQYAVAHITGLKEPVVVFDMTNKKPGALVRQ